MRSYFRIHVPSVSLLPGASSGCLASRSAIAGPAGADPLPSSLRFAKGRLPNPVGGPVGSDARPLAAGRLIEETLAGGDITLELDRDRQMWMVATPAYAHREYYLPTSHGKWARGGSEITIGDAAHAETYLSLHQANKMSGQAVFEPGIGGQSVYRSEWQRLAKPLPPSGQAPVWYGLAISEGGRPGGGPGAKQGRAVVFSADRWFSFLIPTPSAGAFRGYFPEAAFVMLTGYKDRRDLAVHRGADVDYELSLGNHWHERAGVLNQLRETKLADLLPLVLRNAELLRALATAALQETCIDYDERHVIIGDLSAAGVGAGLFAHTGECKVLD